MNEYRMRPKDSYLQNSQWQELYVLTQHWKSDLLFYKDDGQVASLTVAKYWGDEPGISVSVTELVGRQGV